MTITSSLTEKQLKNLVEDITGGSIISSTGTEAVIDLVYSEDPLADTIVLTGSGFATTGSSLSAGTITGMEFRTSTSSLAVISNISLSASNFNSLLTNGAAFETYMEFLLGDDNPGQSSGGGGVSEIGDSSDDDMSGSSNDDYLRGGDGDDDLHGGHGADDLYGDTGDDHIHGGHGNDRIDGGSGDDTVHYEDSIKVAVNLATGKAKDDSGKDTLSSIENVVGSSGNDLITGNDDNNNLVGGNGDDHISAGGGDDIIEGGAGKDHLKGGSGDDHIDGGSGEDHMSGGLGDDTYIVDSSKDKTNEKPGQGDDTVIAHASYTLTASIETLILADGAGDINGIGGKGNETIIGNAGDNILSGGKGGSDILTGGLGNDSFVFDTKPLAGSFDTITDFTVGQDEILLSDNVFKALEHISLDDAFASYTSGSAPVANEGHYLLYNTQTGALYYDADAGGSKAAVQIALIGTDSHPSLGSSDFNIY